MAYKVIWDEEAVKDGWLYCCTAVDADNRFSGIPNMRSALPSFQRRFIVKRKLTQVMKDAMALDWADEMMADAPKPAPMEPEKVWAAHRDSWEQALRSAGKVPLGAPLDTKAVEALAALKYVEPVPEEPVQPVKPIVLGGDDA